MLVAIGLLLVLKPFNVADTFKDPFPWQTTSRISTGAFAGIYTNEARATGINDMMAAGKRWVSPGDGVLLYGLAGDYLLVGGHPMTNLMWLNDFGTASESTVDYFQRSGRTPDIVFVNRRLIEKTGGLDELADPWA